MRRLNPTHIRNETLRRAGTINTVMTGVYLSGAGHGFVCGVIATLAVVGIVALIF
jgi:hypothetical protein